MLCCVCYSSLHSLSYYSLEELIINYFERHVGCGAHKYVRSVHFRTSMYLAYMSSVIRVAILEGGDEGGSIVGRQCGTVVDYFRVDYFFEYRIR